MEGGGRREGNNGRELDDLFGCELTTIWNLYQTHEARLHIDTGRPPGARIIKEALVDVQITSSTSVSSSTDTLKGQRCSCDTHPSIFTYHRVALIDIILTIGATKARGTQALIIEGETRDARPSIVTRRFTGHDF